MKFELEPYNRGHSNGQLLDDLRRVAGELGLPTLTMLQYDTKGRYARNTLIRRFGSWNRALQSAGLRVVTRRNVSEEELFQNISAVWNHLGHQPRYADMDSAPSTFGSTGYARRFGSWRNALTAFIASMDAAQAPEPSVVARNPRQSPRSMMMRSPGWRLRFLVMRRDQFRCRACGRSPAIGHPVQLVIDHVRPRSQGGETTMDNLQTLCEQCNGGKSDLSWNSQ